MIHNYNSLCQAPPLNNDPNWYLAYLFVCIAKSDYQLATAELEIMIEKLMQIQQRRANVKDFLQDVLTFHEKQNEAQIQQYISQCCQLLRHTSNVKQILESLEAIIEADGIIKDLEMNMFFQIKQLISNEKMNNYQ